MKGGDCRSHAIAWLKIAEETGERHSARSFKWRSRPFLRVDLQPLQLFDEGRALHVEQLGRLHLVAIGLG